MSNTVTFEKLLYGENIKIEINLKKRIATLTGMETGSVMTTKVAILPLKIAFRVKDFRKELFVSTDAVRRMTNGYQILNALGGLTGRGQMFFPFVIDRYLLYLGDILPTVKETDPGAYFGYVNIRIDKNNPNALLRIANVYLYNKGTFVTNNE